jgi:hypothetical protein
MAQRRMFSLKITNSARFLRMPIDSQLLYFHLGLHADDDGVVEAYTVLKLLGSQEDNLKVLSSKGFVKVLNEDLVSFITDWNEHNLIRADRKVDSIYKNLLLKIIPEAEIVEPQPRADTGKVTIAQMRNSTKDLPSNFKAKVLPAFDGDVCPICNETMTFLSSKNMASLQHNKPLAMGGEHIIDNISVICLPCNMKLKNKETGELNNNKVKIVWGEMNGRTLDNQMSAQVRLGKDRVGKDSKGEDINTDETSSSIEIPLLIKAFEGLNPASKKFYGNPTQRKACQFLIDTYGLERVISIVEKTLPKTNGLQYFPTITTPLQLQDKYTSLESAIKRYQSENLKSKSTVAF